MTYSGVHVTPTAGVPTIHDMAVSLARIFRCAGSQVVPFSVLQHSLAVADVMASEGPLGELVGLLHDAVESVTSDIPAGLKTAAQELQEDIMFTRWWNAMIGPQGYVTDRYELRKAADRAVWEAERYWQHCAKALEHKSKEVAIQAGATKASLLAVQVWDCWSLEQLFDPQGDPVRTFVDRAEALIEKVTESVQQSRGAVQPLRGTVGVPHGVCDLQPQAKRRHR